MKVDEICFTTGSLNMNGSQYVKEIVQDVSSEINQVCSKASKNIYMKGYTPLHFSMALQILVNIFPGSCTPILVNSNTCNISVSHYGSCIKYFGKPIPNPRLRTCTKIYMTG